MAIICANVKISGTRPLLFNRFTEDAIPITKQENGEFQETILRNGKNFSSYSARSTILGSYLYFLLFTCGRKIYT